MRMTYVSTMDTLPAHDAAEQHPNYDDCDEQYNDINRLLMGEIVPGLWIGSVFAIRELKKRPNTQWTIVSALSSVRLTNLADRHIRALGDDENATSTRSTRNNNLIRNRVLWEIKDKPQAELISQRLVEVMEMMDDAIDPALNRACLVHCAFGVSRSAAICAAWLMSRRGCTLTEALDNIRKVRSVSPNIGFLAGLRALEQCHGDVDAARDRLGMPKDEEERTVEI